MYLNVPLTQISGPRGHVSAAYLNPEEVVSSRFAVVANRNLEIHGIPAHSAGAAERDLVWSGLDESQYLRRNQMNVLLLILIIQMSAQRVVGIEAEVYNLREDAAAAGHLDYRTWRGWRRRRWRRRTVRAASKHKLRTAASQITLSINIRREGLPAEADQH